jgi:titin
LNYQNFVLELPVEFVTKLKDVQAKEKETATFECELNREVSDIKWLKAGIEIKPDETKYRIFNEGNKSILEILDCQLDDTSDYAIVVRGRKSAAQLNVEGKCSISTYL